MHSPRLDPRQPAVARLLRDARTMSTWEMLRRFGRATAPAELAKACGLPVDTVKDILGTLVGFGLAAPAPVRKGGRRAGFRAIGERITLEIDPSHPADAALLASLSRSFEVESRERIERSLENARKGLDGHGRNHAYAYLALTADEAKELLSLFAPVDAFVARIANRPAAPDGPAPMRCNYHLAIHVAPMEDLMLPRARILLAKRGMTAPMQARDAREPTRRLSDREREVASMLAAGLTGPEVAARLGIKASSVSTLTMRIYRKLGIRRRSQLVARLKGLG